MSGDRSDPLATLMRGALGAASLIYRVGVHHRNRGFETGKREVHHCGVPVISVGNLTTGGTGKTPIVCFLAQMLRAKGVRVAIVSRGYGRGDEDANDEAMELHDRLPDVPHVQDPDRVEAARVAVEELESQVILMDDGFQHRRLYRDLDIVVVDATCPFGYGHVLPRGLLREPIDGIRRADLVIVSRCDLIDEEECCIDREILSEEFPKTFRSSVVSTHRPLCVSIQMNRARVRSYGGRMLQSCRPLATRPHFKNRWRVCGATIVDSEVTSGSRSLLAGKPSTA